MARGTAGAWGRGGRELHAVGAGAPPPGPALLRHALWSGLDSQARPDKPPGPPVCNAARLGPWLPRSQPVCARGYRPLRRPCRSGLRARVEFTLPRRDPWWGGRGQGWESPRGLPSLCLDTALSPTRARVPGHPLPASHSSHWRNLWEKMGSLWAPGPFANLMKSTNEACTHKRAPLSLSRSEITSRRF